MTQRMMNNDISVSIFESAEDYMKYLTDQDDIMRYLLNRIDQLPDLAEVKDVAKAMHTTEDNVEANLVLKYIEVRFKEGGRYVDRQSLHNAVVKGRFLDLTMED